MKLNTNEIETNINITFFFMVRTKSYLNDLVGKSRRKAEA